MKEHQSKKGRVAPQLHLRVTRECIEDGCRADSSRCMVARAVLRKFPQAQYIRCDMREISFSDPTTRTRRRYFNTAVGAKSIVRFDQGDTDIRPFALHLNEGVSVPMGWRAKHPGSTRRGKVYRRTGRKGVRYSKYRHFGACNIKDSEIETLF